MVARVTLEIALCKEFDYTIPPKLAGQVEVGSRVKVPFGPRLVFSVVTPVLDETETNHPKLRALSKVIIRQGQITPRCCAWPCPTTTRIPPNEKFSLDCFAKGMAMSAELWQQLAVKA